MKKNRKWQIGKMALVAGILSLSGALFIHFNTAAAAEFTDNVLRPILGPQIVVAMEAVYYNLSDKVQQGLYSPKGSNGVEFVDQGSNLGTADTRLNLAPVAPVANFPPQPGEGVWKIRALRAFPNQAVAAFTYVRPDPERPFAEVTIFQVDMHQMKLGAVAGTAQPGGPVGMPGPGRVPAEIVSSGKLIAAFDGGFQYRDGQYGMVVGQTTYLPLKSDLATLVSYSDGKVKLIDYQGQNLGSGVAFVRQNCPMLIQNGVLASEDPMNKKLWGRTITSGIYTWRSGLGFTKSGNLLFAVGNNLTPDTLATALRMAGAENAMQLDINPYWVRFNIFDSLGGGQYKTSTLVKSLHDGSSAYLHGYTKDFFYLYRSS